jgi:hypothetical protein
VAVGSRSTAIADLLRATAAATSKPVAYNKAHAELDSRHHTPVHADLPAGDQAGPERFVRVAIPGCTKGQIFTPPAALKKSPAARTFRRHAHSHERSEDLIAEIKAHEGSMIQITAS